MNQTVTAVDEKSQQSDDQSPTQPGDSSSVASNSRFAYSSGSRPLEGYTLKRGVGYGGFGEVYYATSDAGKEVALKLIRRNLEIELRGIQQCLNLKNPNLLSIFDIREDGRGDKWVVMEYVAGQSLDAVIAEHPNGLPPAKAMEWIRGIGAGMACLHDHGIVHRDLKPANIFFDEGIVKIGDYGLSKFVSCSRRSGQTESIGTVHYMAPEVANGRYGKEIDVYALGIIFYEMLTGHVPFEGESVAEVLMKHLTATPDVSMLAQPYRGVVAKALEKDPAKRFHSADEMLAWLPGADQFARRAGSFSAEQPPTGHATNGQAAAAAPGVGASPRHNPAADVPEAEGVDEEPVYRAVRRFCRNAHRDWNSSNLNTPTKVVLLVLTAFALMSMAEILAPLAIVTLCFYGCYWLVWSTVSPNKPQAPHPSPPQGAAPYGPPRNTPFGPGPRYGAHAAPRMASRVVRERSTVAMVVKSPRERLTELIGSMLGAAVVTVVTCLLMGIMINLTGKHSLSLNEFTRFGWLILVSIAGAWAVMIPSKFWEGSKGDAKLRRFTLLAMGLLVGLIAAGVAGFLLADLPHNPQYIDTDLDHLTGMQHAGLQADRIVPQITYYLAPFGLLFFLLRWWRQADPMRKSRLSLWWLFVSALMAALVSDACGFPQPWLVMAACAISISVQLASPWIHPRRRNAPNHLG